MLSETPGRTLRSLISDGFLGLTNELDSALPLMDFGLLGRDHE
jgi:hypothetical protein